MPRKERDFITLRFRKQLDDDLKEAVKNLEDGTLSNLARDGLRLILGIRTTKRIEITETVLSLPANMPLSHNPPIESSSSFSSNTSKPLLGFANKKTAKNYPGRD